ncbi:MAG: sugar transferase [Sphingobacteriales bacterium]|nr:MAG: sugar transferase [Sphingobacteriales bacterium]
MSIQGAIARNRVQFFKTDDVFAITRLKRFFDIIFSITAILVLSPLFLAVILVLKVEGKGAVFYLSKRIGNLNIPFTMFKFRTMHEESTVNLEKFKYLNRYICKSEYDKPKVFVKFKNDPRVTRFGAYLRRTHIDELPQLINVLKGEMSIVGNRPLNNEEVNALISLGFVTRFTAPVGLTGLWQIYNSNSDRLSERERIRLDNFYALKHNFFFDLCILLKTSGAFLRNILGR